MFRDALSWEAFGRQGNRGGARRESGRRLGLRTDGARRFCVKADPKTDWQGVTGRAATPGCLIWRMRPEGRYHEKVFWASQALGTLNIVMPMVPMEVSCAGPPIIDIGGSENGGAKRQRWTDAYESGSRRAPRPLTARAYPEVWSGRGARLQRTSLKSGLAGFPLGGPPLASFPGPPSPFVSSPSLR